MLLKVNLTIEGVEGKCQFEVGCTIYMTETGGGYEATERPDLICLEEESEGGFQEQTLTSRASHLETTDQCGKCPDRGQGGATCHTASGPVPGDLARHLAPPRVRGAAPGHTGSECRVRS